MAAYIYHHNQKAGENSLPGIFILSAALAFVASGILAMVAASPAWKSAEGFGFWSFWNYLNWYDALPILAYRFFLLSLVCQNATGYRLCMLVTSGFWAIHTFQIMAYTSMLTYVNYLASLIVGVLRLDLPRRKK